MFEIDKAKFGAFVAGLRREKGYTQKELAQRLFISDKAVSKWETGASIPDTALLIPLAELLDVSVTELLMCERMKREAPMDAGQVDDIVKTVITYSEESPFQPRRAMGRMALQFALSAFTGGAGLLVCAWQGRVSETLLVCYALCLVFGAYFSFFAQERLPAYYDENRIGMYHHGPIRMNLPGVALNNRNWPRVVKTERIWACAAMALFPLIAACMNRIWPEVWMAAERYVYLALTLGGLVIPVYIVGRKYE